jgi:hypothetical protein
MADPFSILSAGYKAAGAAVPSNTKYVPVDPILFKGTWTGTYANKKSFTLTVTDVAGFRAKVKYQSGNTVQFQDVLIKDLSFRIGNTKFTLNNVGKAQIKNVVVDPATGSTFLDTAQATLN